MSRIKSVFAVLLLTAIVGIVPQAQAQTFKLVISGSSAMWQTMALGAYNGGAGSTIIGSTGPTFHWTSGSVNLVDNRPSPANVDAGTVWIVWDSAATPNVWVYNKVDSIVGVRCYFAAPKCTVNATAGTLAGVGAGSISSALWGADTPLPASIQNALSTTGAGGVLVNAAATDVRPEDAAWAAARVNSQLGASTAGGIHSDGLDGLGYNANNAPGVPPVFPIGTSGKGVGSPILSAYPASVATANPLAFNITGKDPFTGTTVAAFTVTAVGAAPIVFVIERDKGQLTNLTNASEVQLQQVFSGTNVDASAFGLPAAGINAFLREPLSGTYTTAEGNVFRRPTVYPGNVLGLSQELNVGANNPLNAQPGTSTSSDGLGARYRAIGTGEEVKSVLNSSTKFANSLDGIGYTFFSYGNVGSLAANATAYGYIQLNGVDPIWAAYGSTIDPGESATPGALPTAVFPAAESTLWSNGFSFPNLRNGTYRAWSLLRLVATGTGSTAAVALAKQSNKFVVTTVPDYVPAAAVATTTDLGLKLLRSHYIERDGNGVQLGAAGAATNSPEKGGDVGGLIIPTTIGVTTYKQAQLIQNATATSLGPVARP
jgi:hypothetical protein